MLFLGIFNGNIISGHKIYAVYMHGLKADYVSNGSNAATGEIIILWDIDFVNKKLGKRAMMRLTT